MFCSTKLLYAKWQMKNCSDVRTRALAAVYCACLNSNCGLTIAWILTMEGRFRGRVLMLLAYVTPRECHRVFMPFYFDNKRHYQLLFEAQLSYFRITLQIRSHKVHLFHSRAAIRAWIIWTNSRRPDTSGVLLVGKVQIQKSWAGLTVSYPNTKHYKEFLKLDRRKLHRLHCILFVLSHGAKINTRPIAIKVLFFLLNFIFTWCLLSILHHWMVIFIHRV
jgi:hypothetical protein